MTGRGLNLRQASFLSDGFEVYSIDPLDSPSAEDTIVFTFPSESYPYSSLEALHRILERLGRMDLPGKDHMEAYLRHVTRRNRRPKTLESLFTSTIIFLGLLKDSGKARLEEVTRADVEAFIERSRHPPCGAPKCDLQLRY